MATITQVNQKFQAQLIDPPLAQFLFNDTRMSWLWLGLRLYLGYTWLTSGLGKLSNPAWFGEGAGTALTGFLKGALAKMEGPRPDVQGWYGGFLETMVLPNAPVWSHFVVVGEILVGAALILGLFTGVAAFFGGFMNVNFLMAGTVSTNPFLFVIATWLVLAWKTAGWLGLDRWVLPKMGKYLSPGKTSST